MQVITMFNEKGGVGKTTITAILGAGLAMRGYKVLLIDADGQHNLTGSLGLPDQAGFYKFVKWGDKNKPDFVDVRKLILPVSPSVCPGELFIVPGSNDSWGIPGSMKMTDIVRNLTQRLNLIEKVFDYVLIDTQPSATTLHDGIGLVSDWVICPTDPEAFGAFEGTISTVEHMTGISSQAAAHGYDKAKMLAIIPNKYRANTGLHKHVVDTLIRGDRDSDGEYHLDENDEIIFKGFGDLVWEPLPLRASIPEMQLYRTILMHNAPSLQTNDHLWRIIDRVIDETKVGSRV